MSGTGETREDFAGEERTFRIRLGEIRRIEAKCGARIGEVAQRLARAVQAISATGGNYVAALAAGIEIGAEDVRETLYQGLVGGGMASPEATNLVRSEIDERGLRGLTDHVAVALMVLVATSKAPPIAGESGAKPRTTTRKNRSTSPRSTQPESRSA